MDKEARILQFEKLFQKYKNVNTKKLIFFGGGSTAQIWWNDIEDAKISPVFFIDSNKKGGKFRQYDIKTPQKLENMEDVDDYNIIIFTTNPFMYESMRKQLIGMNIKAENIYSCSALYFSIFQEKIKGMIYDLEDEKSIESLLAFLEARMEGRLIDEKIIDYNRQYFSLYQFSVINKNEVYVDAGAFVGDTLEKFLFEKFGTFESYYAFEPFETNYNALIQRVRRLENEWGIKDRIVCENFALDKEKKYVRVSDSLMPVGALIEEIEENSKIQNTIQTISIDEYFSGRRVTTIKADIEGKEEDMLLGAEKTMKQWKPNMAISIYHKPSDVFNILNLIKAMNKEYKFSIRCYIADGNDTILYAY